MNNHDEFIIYYQETKNKLFNYLMYRLNFNRDLSEDLLMDIVLKAYEKFNLYNSKKGSFKSWIFTIAHNQLINFWRDNEKKKIIAIETLQDGETMSVNDKVNEKMDKIFEKEKISKVLMTMNANESELITLKFINDFDNKEIAKILGKKEGAIRTGLNRALNQFKNLYEKFNT